MSLYFLGLVLKDHADMGIFDPDMIQHQANQSTDKRSGFVVQKTDRRKLVDRDIPKVLVSDITNQEDLITFMSRYRTRDYAHNNRHHRREKTKKYTPEGFQCWYPCDEYGDRIGPAILIKQIPDSSIKAPDQGYQTLKAYRNRIVPLNEILAHEQRGVEMPNTGCKPKLYQHNVGKEASPYAVDVVLNNDPFSRQDKQRSRRVHKKTINKERDV